MFEVKVHNGAQDKPGIRESKMRNSESGNREMRKVAKGYRLKPETHKMIRKIQNYVRGDLDYAINSACRKFLKEIKQDNNKKEQS